MRKIALLLATLAAASAPADARGFGHGGWVVRVTDTTAGRAPTMMGPTGAGYLAPPAYRSCRLAVGTSAGLARLEPLKQAWVKRGR